MLKTRFDETVVWRGAGNKQYLILDMDTAHLVNTLRMFKEKPVIVISMVLDDFERSTVFRYKGNNSDKVQSIHNLTSMSEMELRDFALNSTVAQAMVQELSKRGVNVENIMTYTGSLGNVKI